MMMMMLRVLALVAMIALASSGPPYVREFNMVPMEELEPAEEVYKLSYADYSETWTAYKADFGKVYPSPQEEQARFMIFMENLKFIESHNWKFHNGRSTFWLGLTNYADMTTEEVITLNGWDTRRQLSLQERKARNCTAYKPATKKVPDSLDWKEKGIVGPVKNQIYCGACWAFSTTGALESHWTKKHGKNISLSEQQLVDCSRKDHGCGGGWMDYAFEYVMKAGGIEKESDYPYEDKDATCHYKTSDVAVKIQGCKDVVPKHSEAALKVAIGNVGPVSVAIDASSKEFHHYKGGVYHVPDCETDSPDHAVLAVGYGTTKDNIDFWNVKNSWGTKWGAGGYIKMIRNHQNACGLATYASFPVL